MVKLVFGTINRHNLGERNPPLSLRTSLSQDPDEQLRQAETDLLLSFSFSFFLGGCGGASANSEVVILWGNYRQVPLKFAIN